MDPCDAQMDPCDAQMDPCDAQINPRDAQMDPCDAQMDPCDQQIDLCDARETMSALSSAIATTGTTRRVTISVRYIAANICTRAGKGLCTAHELN